MSENYQIITDYGFENVSDAQSARTFKLFYIACDFPPEAQSVESALAALETEIAPLLRQVFFVDKEISILMLTIIGAVSAKDFESAWRQQLAQDIFLKSTVKNLLQTAVVIHGDNDGNVLGEADLLTDMTPS